MLLLARFGLLLFVLVFASLGSLAKQCCKKVKKIVPSFGVKVFARFGVWNSLNFSCCFACHNHLQLQSTKIFTSSFKIESI